MRDATFSVSAALLLLFTTCTQASLIPAPDPLPVSSLCAATTCPVGRACRVVQSCAGPGCPPQSACLPCVPEGVDDVCNSYRYIYAVLVGDVSSPDQLSARSCDPNQPSGSPNCPDGSVCVPDNNGRGHCCFGKPDPQPASGVVFNDDPICGDRPCGGCECRYVCRKQAIVCVTYPCDPFVYTCVKVENKEKDGYCPMLPLYIPDWCFERDDIEQDDIEKDDRRSVDHACKEDCDCPGTYKCCSDQCGKRVCTPPFN